MYSARGKTVPYMPRHTRPVIVSLEYAVLYVNLRAHKGAWVEPILREYRLAVETIARSPTETPTLYHLRRIVLTGRPLDERGYEATPHRVPRYEWGAAIMAMARAVAANRALNLRAVPEGEFDQPRVNWQAVVHSLRGQGWTHDDVRRRCGAYKWQGFPWRRWAAGISPCYILGSYLLDLEHKTRAGLIHPDVGRLERQRRKGSWREKGRARRAKYEETREELGF